MPALELEPKNVDPDAELNKVQQTFLKLSKKCNVASKAKHVPLLGPQEKQIAILRRELKETQLKLKVAKKGKHAIQAAHINKSIQESVINYEHLNDKLRNERSQEAELDIMNRLAEKTISEMSKAVPTEHEELALIEEAQSRLRRMENKLDLVNQRFCVINADNKRIREEINILLVERNNFNIEWNRTIQKLTKGKEYMMDVLEGTTTVFANRYEMCNKLKELTYKGVYHLNKDISKMQHYNDKLNRLAKLEEFLRIKGTYRLCETDEIVKAKEQQKIDEVEQKKEQLYDLLAKIYAFAGTNNVNALIKNFRRTEIENQAKFVYLCQTLQECVNLKHDREAIFQKILDQQDINQARVDVEDKRLAQLTEELKIKQKLTADKLQLNNEAEENVIEILNSIGDLVNIAKCDLTPMLSLLSNNTEVNLFNVNSFLKVLEIEIKNLIQVAYGIVKAPARTPYKVKDSDEVKIIADPYVRQLRPNRLEILVPYKPCAYCVEDYIRNLIYEEPATPADKDYIENIFHLEDINTKFGIYTLTEPSKRHPFKAKRPNVEINILAYD